MTLPRSLWARTGPHRDVEGAGASARRRDGGPHEPPPPPPPPLAPWWKRGMAASVVILALAALVLLVDRDGEERATQAAAPATLAGAPPKTDAGKVAAAASPAVVSVQVNRAGGSASGTGFVVARNGTIVTNAHVVGASARARVRFNDRGRQVEADVLGTDPSSDLAALRVDPGDAGGGLRPVKLGDSDNVAVGDDVIAIGHPFNLDRTVTAGIVSGVGRQIDAPNGFQIDEVIQTDAAINPGNSGGPLLDARGQVVGVNSQIATDAGRGNVGIGFAVPSNTVRDVLPRLERGQRIERPYMGVSTAPAPNGGASVEQVVPGGPAADAGLQAGRDTIVSVGGHQVTDPGDVLAGIRDKKPGETVDVEVRRGGETRTVEVKLGTRPERTP